jgi:hypothetical protein
MEYPHSVSLAPGVAKGSSLIHTFHNPLPKSPSPITMMVQSPAIDVVGVGYLDGSVRIWDIRQGELVMQVKMEEGSVTGLAFRMGESGGCCSADARRSSHLGIFVVDRVDRVVGFEQRRADTACAEVSARAGCDRLGMGLGSTPARQFEWGQQCQSECEFGLADNSNGSSTRPHLYRGCSSSGAVIMGLYRVYGTMGRMGNRF